MFMEIHIVNIKDCLAMVYIFKLDMEIVCQGYTYVYIHKKAFAVVAITRLVMRLLLVANMQGKQGFYCC